MEFYSSKSWIIVLILPLFITFLFATVYHQATDQAYKIAYTPALQPQIITLLEKSHLQPVKYAHLQSAKDALEQHAVDAVLLPHATVPNRYTLLVTQSGYSKAITISNALNVVMVRIFANPTIPQFDIQGPSQKGHLDWVALPLWLIQIILTICLLQATATVADEKERQTLHALLVSPMRLTEYLSAKLSWSTFLGLFALMLTWLLTRAPAQVGYILTFGMLGALLYSAVALLIGITSPNALFARTISTVLYLGSSLPLMVNQTNVAWKNLFNLFPTFLVMRGFEASLVQTAHSEVMTMVGWLLAETIALIAITYFAFKQKADF